MNKSEKSKNKKNQNKEGISNNLEDEIAQYLAQTEKVVKKQEEADKVIAELKVKEQSMLESIKNLPSEEIFNRIVEIINEALIEEENSKKAKREIEDAKSQMSLYYENIQNINHQMGELDAHNKNIFDKIKAITDESKKLLAIEEEKTKDIKRQCDEFKEKTQNEYNKTSNSVIVKDNEALQAKLEECKSTTEKIKENIEGQFKSKETDSMNFQEIFQTQIQDKLNDLTKQSDQYDKENDKLKDDLSEAQKKYETLENSMKKFNKKFKTAKKEYEKTIKELRLLENESQEVRFTDKISIQKEIDKNEDLLKDLVAKNKELQNKIKEIKEQ